MTAREAATSPSTEWRRVCGVPIRGMFMSFPCCKEPDHDGEHSFAAYHATYRVVGGLMYEREGRAIAALRETEDVEADRG